MGAAPGRRTDLERRRAGTRSLRGGPVACARGRRPDSGPDGRGGGAPGAAAPARVVRRAGDARRGRGSDSRQRRHRGARRGARRRAGRRRGHLARSDRPRHSQGARRRQHQRARERRRLRGARHGRTRARHGTLVAGEAGCARAGHFRGARRSAPEARLPAGLEWAVRGSRNLCGSGRRQPPLRGRPQPGGRGARGRQPRRPRRPGIAGGAGERLRERSAAGARLRSPGAAPLLGHGTALEQRRRRGLGVGRDLLRGGPQPLQAGAGTRARARARRSRRGLPCELRPQAKLGQRSGVRSDA